MVPKSPHSLKASSTKPHAQVADPTITSFTIRDLRFPTSLDNIGSDPMKYVCPLYSEIITLTCHIVLSTAGENAHGYIVYHTDVPGLEGIGWSFSNGQGNE